MEHLAMAAFVSTLLLAFAHLQLRWKVKRMGEEQGRLRKNFVSLRTAINQMAAMFFAGGRKRGMDEARSGPSNSPPPHARPK